MNRRGRNLKSLIVDFAKKKKLQQDQQETTETNKIQNKPKQNKANLKAKQPVKKERN